MTPEFDRHHIPAHKSKSQWRSSEAGRLIINTPSLIPRIERATHEEINRICPMVPVLGCCSLIAVAREFETTHNTFKDVDRLRRLIEQAGKHYKADISERAVCELASYAIGTQIPILRSQFGSGAKIRT